jgi:hypothetical protein
MIFFCYGVPTHEFFLAIGWRSNSLQPSSTYRQLQITRSQITRNNFFSMEGQITDQRGGEAMVSLSCELQWRAMEVQWAPAAASREVGWRDEGTRRRGRGTWARRQCGQRWTSILGAAAEVQPGGGRGPAWLPVAVRRRRHLRRRRGGARASGSRGAWRDERAPHVGGPKKIMCCWLIKHTGVC